MAPDYLRVAVRGVYPPHTTRLSDSRASARARSFSFVTWHPRSGTFVPAVPSSVSYARPFVVCLCFFFMPPLPPGTLTTRTQSSPGHNTVFGAFVCVACMCVCGDPFVVVRRVCEEKSSPPRRASAKYFFFANKFTRRFGRLRDNNNKKKK